MTAPIGKICVKDEDCPVLSTGDPAGRELVCVTGKCSCPANFQSDPTSKSCSLVEGAECTHVDSRSSP